MPAMGERGEGFHPQVYPGFLSKEENGCTGTSAQEKEACHHPLSRPIVTVLGVPSTGRDQRTRDTPDLRQDQETIVQRRAVAILLEGEGVEAIAALVARKACFLASLETAKERLIRLIQTRQHILELCR